MNVFARCFWVAALVLSVAGCGAQPTTIQGKVTYNGQPVEMGAISFRPTDGKGQVFAAQILDGAYSIPKASPGNRTVIIRGTKKVNFGQSTEEAIRLSQEAAAAGQSWAGHVSEPADYIPEDAEGNNQTVEIKNGDQTLDFEIKGPPRK